MPVLFGVIGLKKFRPETGARSPNAKDSWLGAIASLQNHSLNTSLKVPSSILSQLRVVEPAKWKDTRALDLQVASTYDGSMHTTWDAGGGRFHGIEDKPIPPSEGGRRVG